MKAYDVIAYTYNGAIYCEDCEPAKDGPDDVGAWFADDEESLIGQTCDACRACYYPDDGWSQTEPTAYRWSCCDSCNSQRPYERSNSEARLAALRSELVCRECLRPTEHF